MKEKDKIRAGEMKRLLDNFDFIEKLIKEVENPDRDFRTAPKIRRGRSPKVYKY